MSASLTIHTKKLKLLYYARFCNRGCHVCPVLKSAHAECFSQHNFLLLNACLPREIVLHVFLLLKRCRMFLQLDPSKRINVIFTCVHWGQWRRNVKMKAWCYLHIERKNPSFDRHHIWILQSIHKIFEKQNVKPLTASRHGTCLQKARLSHLLLTCNKHC